jgi:hypothetical protein
VRLFRRSHLTAAAMEIPADPSDRPGAEPAITDWQANAWEYWRNLPEVAYPSCLTASVLGRYRIGIVDGRTNDRIDTNTSDTPSARSARELAQMILFWLSSETFDMSPMFTRWGLFGSVPGEARILYTDHPTNGVTVEVVDRSELHSRRRSINGRAQLTWYRQMTVNGDAMELDATHTKVYRLWFPGQRSGDAWSPMQSLDTSCRILTDLYGFLDSLMKSRLARNGMVFIPSSLTLTSPIGVPDHALKHVNDPLFRSLIYASMKSLKKTGTAADWSPMYLRGPDQAGERIRWISMDREIPKADMELRNELREEISAGMWMPKEYASGGSLGDANHWSAWSDRASAKAEHWEPLADVLIQAVGANIVRPWLQAMSLNQSLPEGWQFWKLVPDSTAVDMPPDRARTSTELHKDGAISDESRRRSNGFSEADAPSVDEQIRFIGRASANPYMATFGLDLPDDFDLELAGITQPEATGPDPSMVDSSYLAITEGTPGQPGDPNFSSAAGI